MTKFGERLKELRLEKNLSQLDIANVLGRSKNSISQYERGIRQTDDETKEILASYFDVSMDYLVGRSDDRHYSLSNDAVDKRNEVSKKLDEILIRNGIIKPGEDLSDEQVEWLMKLVDKAIDMTKLND